MNYDDAKKLLVEIFGISPEYTLILTDLEKIYLPILEYRSGHWSSGNISMNKHVVTTEGGVLYVAWFNTVHETKTIYLRVIRGIYAIMKEHNEKS